MLGCKCEPSEPRRPLRSTPCTPNPPNLPIPPPASPQVPADRCLPDPPLLRLEAEASQAYLSTLLHISTAGPEATRQACSVEARLVQLCMRNLERFEGQGMAMGNGEAAASECFGGRGCGRVGAPSDLMRAGEACLSSRA